MSSHSDPMTVDLDQPFRWRFRLQLVAGLALLLLALMALRARSQRAAHAAGRGAVEAALHQLVQAQDEHYARTGRYATTLDSALAWRPAPSVSVVFVATDDQNWRAVATDSSLVLPPNTCGVFVGRQSGAPHRAVLEPGVVSCW